jgi:membrane fusion protein, multidrug efflux system
VKRRELLLVAVLASPVFGLGSGCDSTAAKPAEAKPIAVPVAKPIRRDVTDFVDYTGRTNAIDSINILPRVTGFLIKMPFKEGSDVKKGDLLFEIDPRPYAAQYAAAAAQLAQSEASQKYAKATNERFKALAEKEPGAVSKQELDQYQAQEEQAIANVGLAKANLDAAKLNLDWTKVEAPIDGHISRTYFTVHNLVNQDQTLLTTVVSMDPMFVYFDMDESTLLKIKRAINDGIIELPKEGAEIPVLMGLEGESGFPHKGRVNFVDNQVNATTGSISVRGLFDNPRPKMGEREGTRLLVPGMFARVRFPIGQPRPSVLIIDQAIGSDQGIKYVYTVDSENKLQYQRVTTGPLQEDGLRVIVDGLKGDEWVVVGKLQQLGRRMLITPDQVPMPTLGSPLTGSGAGSKTGKKGKGSS